MKTFIVRIIVACVGILLLGTLLANALHAQTIISFDSTPDNSMVMKIQDPHITEKPNKLVLIFDSASITYDFSKDGEIALLTTSVSGGIHSTNFYVTAYPENKPAQSQEKKIQAMMNTVLEETEEVEEPMEIETWMLQPRKWLN